ncbi:MAG: hypothetical protein OEY94_05040 [Alphaproteobacteria bacterium]|nr:hypothetical protein [Alphaproteobacteria bacterium]
MDKTIDIKSVLEEGLKNKASAELALNELSNHLDKLTGSKYNEAIHAVGFIGAVYKDFALQVLDILKGRKGESVTKSIGLMAAVGASICLDRGNKEGSEGDNKGKEIFNKALNMLRSCEGNKEAQIVRNFETQFPRLIEQGEGRGNDAAPGVEPGSP